VSAKPTKSPKKAKPPQVFGNAGALYSFPQGEGGPIQIQINFASAPEPQQYYYADSIHVVVDEELRMAILSFGRREANTNKFADRIEIIMPARALFTQFLLSFREVEATLDKILESVAIIPKSRSMASPETPTAAALFANLIFVAVGDGESVLDFYQLSARDVHFAKVEKKDMKLQPTIRVFASPVLIKYFFNLLRPFAQEQGNFQPEGGNVRATGRSR
jgi:hypothetical protein